MNQIFQAPIQSHIQLGPMMASITVTFRDTRNSIQLSRNCCSTHAGEKRYDTEYNPRLLRKVLADIDNILKSGRSAQVALLRKRT